MLRNMGYNIGKTKFGGHFGWRPAIWFQHTQVMLKVGFKAALYLEFYTESFA